MSPAITCPGCGAVFGGHTGYRFAGEAPLRPPGEGDMTLCSGCGAVGVFVVGVYGVAVREATTAELESFAANRKAQVLARAVLQMRAARDG